MCSRYLVFYKLFITALAGLWLGCAVTLAHDHSPAIVDKVERIKVIRDAPIAVELTLGQDNCIAWENIILKVRFKNVTEEPIELRAFAPNSALAYIWVSINDGTFTRIARVHPGDLYLPPRGRRTSVLNANEVMEFRVYLINHEFVVPLSKEWLTQDALIADAFDFSLIVCPVFVIVEDEKETPIAVESNILNINVDAPTERQQRALHDLVGFWRMPRDDHRPPEERFREYLLRYPDVPYAARVRFELTRSMIKYLHDYKRGIAEPDPVLIESIHFCLDKRSPFADVVLTRTYIDFFSRTRRWALLERAGKLLAEAPAYDSRFHEAQMYAGQAGLSVIKEDTNCHDPVWQRKLRPVLLKCLGRALKRNDERAKRIAPRLLKDLEHLQEWRLLELAAKAALNDDWKKDEARRALELAQQNIAKKTVNED